MKFYSSYRLRRKEGVKLRFINKIIRILDTKEPENEYSKKKHGYKYDFIDIEAQNSFKVGRVTISIIRYTHGYNHYS